MLPERDMRVINRISYILGCGKCDLGGLESCTNLIFIMVVLAAVFSWRLLAWYSVGTWLIVS